VEECCSAGQATDDNMAHALCMLDAQGYKRVVRICNNYCFFSATGLARTCLNVTLYLHLPVLLFLTCSCFSVRGQVSHPYVTTNQIVFLSDLIYIDTYRRPKSDIFLN